MLHKQWWDFTNWFPLLTHVGQNAVNSEMKGPRNLLSIPGTHLAPVAVISDCLKSFTVFMVTNSCGTIIPNVQMGTWGTERQSDQAVVEQRFEPGFSKSYASALTTAPSFRFLNCLVFALLSTNLNDINVLQLGDKADSGKKTLVNGSGFLLWKWRSWFLLAFMLQQKTTDIISHSEINLLNTLGQDGGNGCIYTEIQNSFLQKAGW